MTTKVQPSARLEWLRAVIRQCTPAAIRVACEVEARWSDERGCSYPSVGTLAHDCLLNERTVQRGIKELEHLGFMEVFRPDNQGRNMANEYVPTWAMSRLGRVTKAPPIDDGRVTFSSKKGDISVQERVTEMPPQQGISKNKVFEQGDSNAGATPDPSDEHDLAAPAQPVEPSTDDPSAWSYQVAAKPWAKTLTAAGCKIGRSNWRQWEGLVARVFAGNATACAAAALAVPADKRWPDAVEVAAAKAAPATQPAQTSRFARRVHLVTV